MEHFEKGDIAGGIGASNLIGMHSLELAFAEAYNSGGTSLVDNLPKLKAPGGNRVISGSVSAIRTVKPSFATILRSS
ncbi:hypothetical protein [Phyllobacterium zundukense]|uniref:Uncharacterized protein n=1 Tax=Phyllobacterium zundukense TaxID=1867719 RepID=A0ACD4CZR4_9HYPH|nr:hypothetical protein [Phyllobacterium zundukense]UXN59123.1 hypothetical protein N8E88_09655 [Phyllobacterium zundukense]